MKRLTSLMLILLMSCQCLVQLGMVTYFQLKREYIAEFLCINREKPQLQCQGQCYLKDQLSKTSDQSEVPANNPQDHKLEIPSFLLSGLILKMLPPTAAKQKFILLQATGTPTSPSLAIFHPPCT